MLLNDFGFNILFVSDGYWGRVFIFPRENYAVFCPGEIPASFFLSVSCQFKEMFVFLCERLVYENFKISASFKSRSLAVIFRNSLLFCMNSSFDLRLRNLQMMAASSLGPFRWQAWMWCSSHLIPNFSPRLITSDSAFSFSFFGIPEISRQSRRPYCSKSLTSLLKILTSRSKFPICFNLAWEKKLM